MTGKAAMLFAMTLLWWVFGTPPAVDARGTLADAGDGRQAVAADPQPAARELQALPIKSASSGDAR